MDFALPLLKKQQWRIKFSLRFLLVLLTVVCFFVYRNDQRSKFQVVAQKIRERGGTIFYPWQDPTVRSHLLFFPTPTQAYTVQLPDGRRETKTRTVPIKGQQRFAVNINKFCLTDSEPSRFRIHDFLFGYHSDVNFTAISIPASALDQETIRLLSGIEDLDNILLEVDSGLLRAEAIARRERADQQPPNLEQMRADLRRVVQLVQEHLPEVSLNTHGLTRDQKPGFYEPHPSDVFCPKCLAWVYPDWTWCGKCGYRRQPQAIH